MVESITIFKQHKAYVLILDKKDKGYVVNYRNGKRENISGGGTLTPAPVSLEKARSIYAARLDKKTKDGYGPDPVAAAEVNASAIEIAEPSEVKHDVGCKLLTEISAVNSSPEAIVAAATRLLRDSNYAAQKKFDGWRMVAYASPKRSIGYNRKGLPRNFPKVVGDELKALASAIGPVMLDGEVIGDKYIVFDLLEFDGKDYRADTYEHRQFVLKNMFQCAASLLKMVRYDAPAFSEADKTALLMKLIADGAEGIVFLRCDSRYKAGRQNDQFKLKFTKMASFVVVKLNDKNSVQVGLYDDAGQIVVNGDVTIRNGFFKPKPGDVLEIKYLYAHRATNHISQARMIATRDDVDPSECLLSQLQYKVDE